MKYRVIDEGGDGNLGRYCVQHSPYGHTWSTDSRHADKLTAVRAMESLARPPVVVASTTTDDDPVQGPRGIVGLAGPSLNEHLQQDAADGL